MFQLLVDLESNCSDYGIALYIHIIRQVLDIVHIVVPIVLMVMVAINLIQLMMDPDDQKKIKMSLIIHLISYSGLVPDDFTLIDCYKDSEKIYGTMK